MSWLDVFSLANIHRETYIAIIKSWIPHGKIGDFARKIGISREYFSYLCALDHTDENKFLIKRLPSPQLIKKITETFPAPAEIRRSLAENMELAHVNATRVYYYVTHGVASQREISELLSELGQAHGQAMFGINSTEVQRAYRVVRDAAASLLPRLSSQKNPASLAQTCLYLHDAQCVLDRADDALRYAKLARLVLEDQEVYEFGFNREQVDNLEINAVRGEAVAYHNLGLDREVPQLNARACATSAYRNDEAFWKPWVGRDLLNAMVQIPRYSYREADEIAHEIEAVCEHKRDEFMLFLVREAWLRSLIQRDKLKQAQKVFQEESERLPRLPYVGYLHRALLLKSGARLAWKQGDRATWNERIRETLTLMHQAGLAHQMRSVLEFYGPAINPILEDVVSLEYTKT